MVTVSLPREQVRTMWSANVVCTNAPVIVAPACFGHGTGCPAQNARARSRSCCTSLAMCRSLTCAPAIFDLFEDPHEVRAEDLLHITLGHSALQQPRSQQRQSRCSLQSGWKCGHAIEVAAD